MANEGVIVGCDENQQWLLSWWWSHYSKHNQHPVVFVDFGMTEEAKKWCRQKGTLISLQSPSKFIASRSQIDHPFIEEWERLRGENVWQFRESWFRKPFAMLQTPFETTIWIDLDCEVTGSIVPLFQRVHNHSGIALAAELLEGEYNSGVVVYHKESPLIARWAETCLYENARFLGDQEVLSFLINHGDFEVSVLPDIYNWRVMGGVNCDAVILHWVGAWGKDLIRRSLVNISPRDHLN